MLTLDIFLNPSPHNPENKIFENAVGKEENAGKSGFSVLPTFSTLLDTNTISYSSLISSFIMQMLSISTSLKVCLIGNPLPDSSI